MGYVPERSFPFKVIYDGALYEGWVLPLRQQDQPFPDKFRLMIGGLVFVQLHNDHGVWMKEYGEEMEPDLLERLGDYIQAHYQ